MYTDKGCQARCACVFAHFQMRAHPWNRSTRTCRPTQPSSGVAPATEPTYMTVARWLSRLCTRSPTCSSSGMPPSVPIGCYVFFFLNSTAEPVYEGRCGPESDDRHSARGASAYSRALSRFECWQQHAILNAAKAPRSCRTLTPATFVLVLCSRRGGRSAAVSVRMQESGSVAGGRHLAYDCGKPLGARHAARFQTRTHTQALPAKDAQTTGWTKK